MSTSSWNGSVKTLDAETIEHGIQAGRRLRARAFGSALKALFSRKHQPAARDEGTRMPDCVAPA